MDALYIILAIVWSILCLILFFKVWVMTNDVREIKDHLIYNSPSTSGVIEDTNKEVINLTPEQVKSNLEAKQNKINVTWNHKYNVGDIVMYKHSKKKLKIALILEKEKEYKCFDAETEQLLSAVFTENELV